MPSNKDILISVFIPVKNGAGWIQPCIEHIMQQTCYDRTEIVIVDSGSTDNTLDILKEYPVTVYSIPPHEFNHGSTRNLALQYCRGEYIVMTVQDAKAANEVWLEELLKGFDVTTNVAGVCGMQIVPHETDKNPVEWFRPQSESKVRVYRYDEAQAFDNLTPEEKKNAASWDDVTAMYKKVLLQQLPFEKITYGEDAVWATAALRKGYALAYNPAARVYHYHHENEDYTFKRVLTTSYLRYRLFGVKPVSRQYSLVDNLRLVKTIWTSGPMNNIEKVKWLRYNLSQRKAMQKAFEVFTEALKKGERELENVHEKFCGKPPVPINTKVI